MKGSGASSPKITASARLARFLPGAPQAIEPEKQLVRGLKKWQVDFDKCLPYFNDTLGCGICIAVCPWSRPGVAGNLITKLAKRNTRKSKE